jgi:hypothetical protein
MLIASIAVNVLKTHGADDLRPSEYRNLLNSYKLRVYLG